MKGKVKVLFKLQLKTWYRYWETQTIIKEKEVSVMSVDEIVILHIDACIVL